MKAQKLAEHLRKQFDVVSAKVATRDGKEVVVARIEYDGHNRTNTYDEDGKLIDADWD